MAKKNPEITEAAPTNGLESFLQTRGRATVDTGAAWFRTWPANAQADLRTLCLKPGQADLQVRFAGDPATKPEDPATKALLGLMSESDAFDGANGTDSMARTATALEEHARRARTTVNAALKPLLEGIPINAGQANQSVFNNLRAMLDVETSRAKLNAEQINQSVFNNLRVLLNVQTSRVTKVKHSSARKNKAEIKDNIAQARKSAREMLNYLVRIYTEAHQAPSQIPLTKLTTAASSDEDLDIFLAEYDSSQILITLTEVQTSRVATVQPPPARKNEAEIQAKIAQARRSAREMLNYLVRIYTEAYQAPSQIPLTKLTTAASSDEDLDIFLAEYDSNQILITLAEAENHRKELLKPPAAPEPAHALYRGIEGQMFGIDGAAQKEQQDEVVQAALRAVFTTHFDSLQKRDGSRLGAAFARLRAGKPDEIIHKIPFFQGMEINSTEQQIEERLTQQNVSNANIAKAIAIIQESAQASFQWKPEIRDGMRAPLERFMRRLESILAARMTAEYMGQQNVNPPQGMAKIIAAWHKSVTGAQQRPEDALRAIGGGPAAPATGGTTPAAPAEGGGGGTAAGTAAAVAAEGAVGAAAGGIFNRVRRLLPGGNSVAGQLKNQARRAARRRGGNNPY